jgi:hypothetical protein
MQPARGPLVAKGWCCTAPRPWPLRRQVYDGEGRLCSHATGTFKYMPRTVRPGSKDTKAP